MRSSSSEEVRCCDRRQRNLRVIIYSFFSQSFDVKRLSRTAATGGERTSGRAGERGTWRRIWEPINKQSDGSQRPKNNLRRFNGAAATRQVAQG